VYGSFVRAAREARGLTQHDLAVTSGVVQSNISAIENGRRIPSADTLNRLLVACGFELAATSGDRAIYCPLPRGGAFQEDDPWPGGAPGDPPDERPTLAAGASAEERARVLTAVLDAVDATRQR
jgi:transcriptional regulator with XRE-family HTH domain